MWFQKISIPPPPPEEPWKFRGEGGVKGSNCQAVGGVHGETMFQRVMDHAQNIKINV